MLPTSDKTKPDNSNPPVENGGGMWNCEHHAFPIKINQVWLLAWLKLIVRTTPTLKDLWSATPHHTVNLSPFPDRKPAWVPPVHAMSIFPGLLPDTDGELLAILLTSQRFSWLSDLAKQDGVKRTGLSLCLVECECATQKWAHWWKWEAYAISEFWKAQR